MNANVENVVIMEESNQVESALNDTKSKRVVKPKLSTKYEKYLVFGYWYSNMLFQLGSIDNLVITAMLDKLRMYESLENQTALFDAFELESAATQKTVRKLIADYHKPPKASRVSKKPTVSSDGVAVETKKGRKKKATTVVVDNHDDFINQLVAAANTNESTTEIQPINAETVIQTVEVSQNIQSSEINILSTGTPKKQRELTTVKDWEKFSKDVEWLAKDKAKDAEKLAKEAKKQAEKLEKEAKKNAEKLEKEAKKNAEKLAKEEVKAKAKPRTKSPSKKETEGVVANEEVKAKPDAKKEPNEKKASAKKAAIPLIAEVVQENIVVVQEQNDDDEDSHHTRKLEESDNEDENEEEIHAREFIFNGKKYLIDEKTSELYDIETQDLIGKFDSETNTISIV